MKNHIGQVILVPGLLEPRMAFSPLKQVLRKHCQRVEYFQDRCVFRDLERSINGLADKIRNADQGCPIAIVTHSFGDWVARQAIARASEHRVAALVSVAPVMRAGLLTLGLHAVSGDLIPEIQVICNKERASANLDVSESVRRLVLWAKFDAFVRSVSLEHLPQVRVERFTATHLSMVLQPNVLRRIEAFLFSNAA